MSFCRSPGTARARARSRVSLTTMSPRPLSSRTTSPTSVTQDVDVMPANSMRSRNAGTGRPAALTTSRASTCTVMVELRMVAGSKTATVRCAPGFSPSAARRRERLSESAGGSSSSRVSVRVPVFVFVVSSSRRPPFPSVPLTSTAPVPGSSENEKDRRAKALSTRASVRMRAAVEAPSSVIWIWPSS